MKRNEISMAKLIILRGNSGSGKTTIAKKIQKNFGHGTLLISQDVVRREMLYVKDGDKPKVEKLLLQIALYGKNNCNIVILEGILNSKWYRDLFEKLQGEFKENIFAYYFDIPFEETVKRHKQRAISNEFGEEEMKKWWIEKDLLNFIPETIIRQEMGINEIIEMICKDINNEIN